MTPSHRTKAWPFPSPCQNSHRLRWRQDWSQLFAQNQALPLSFSIMPSLLSEMWSTQPCSYSQGRVIKAWSRGSLSPEREPETTVTTSTQAANPCLFAAIEPFTKVKRDDSTPWLGHIHFELRRGQVTGIGYKTAKSPTEISTVQITLEILCICTVNITFICNLKKYSK